MPSVTFVPSGVSVRVAPGTTVAAAAQVAGVALTLSCGGRGTCGLCAVRVVAGSLGAPNEAEQRGLARGRSDVRLACLAQVTQDVQIAPLFGAEQTSESAQGVQGAKYVVAVDLGTTTVAARLMDAHGSTRGEAVAGNSQVAWGGDVLTRISAAAQGHAEDLRTAAVRSITQALEAAGASGSGIDSVVVAGNTAMAALLAGIDPSPLGRHPFTAPEIPRTVELAILKDRPPLLSTILPPIASFVGGDILAGIVASGMLHRDGPEMLVDLGTNAEIVLRAGEQVWVASAPAGPAFEGAGISCGMPAVAGAVISVHIRSAGVVDFRTIGDVTPAGLSGAGLVSAVSALREVGHVSADGLLDQSGPLRDRFARDAGGVMGVTLDEGGQVVLTQLDVRNFQLAKAAVQVGVRTVLDAAGVSPADVAVVHLAGGFGSALAADDLACLGVLSRTLARVVRYAGNGSLEGASAIARDAALLDDALAAIGTPTHVDLATSPGFTDALMSATALEAVE